MAKGKTLKDQGHEFMFIGQPNQSAEKLSQFLNLYTHPLQIDTNAMSSLILLSVREKLSQ
jgi:hypothetical protein